MAADHRALLFGLIVAGIIIWGVGQTAWNAGWGIYHVVTGQPSDMDLIQYTDVSDCWQDHPWARKDMRELNRLCDQPSELISPSGR